VKISIDTLAFIGDNNNWFPAPSNRIPRLPARNLTPETISPSTLIVETTMKSTESLKLSGTFRSYHSNGFQYSMESGTLATRLSGLYTLVELEHRVELLKVEIAEIRGEGGAK
jgi:hypothetical protein